MRALQCASARQISQNPLGMMDVPVPEPKGHEILIRVQACGICHTDLHVIEGELPPRRSPLIPGHQVVGIVQDRGSLATNHNMGDRVGVPWLYSTCGRCDSCTRGEENLCEEARFTGYDVDGGYAEYLVAPKESAYKLPPGFSDESAAPLLCAGVVGFRALRRSNVQPGGRLGLYGFGASAHIVIQVARHWGCETYVFSRSKQHRKLAEELGATWTGTADNVPDRELDGIIIFAPAGELIPKALRALRRGGTLAVAGIYLSPIPAFDYSLIYHERTLQSVANSTRQDVRDFLAIAAEIPVKVQIEVFALEEANRALQLLKEGKMQGAGVLKID